MMKSSGAEKRGGVGKPVGVEIHPLHIFCILPQEPQILPRACPAKEAERVLLPRGDNEIHAPELARTCPEIAENVIISATTCHN